MSWSSAPLVVPTPAFNLTLPQFWGNFQTNIVAEPSEDGMVFTFSPDTEVKVAFRFEQQELRISGGIMEEFDDDVFVYVE